jgi:DNA-directed RNA polymerase subunit RPC12/RpoP
MISFDCPHCHHQRKYTDAALGRKVRCDKCGSRVRVHSETSFSIISLPDGTAPAPKQAPARDHTFSEPVPALRKEPDPDAETPVPGRSPTQLAISRSMPPPPPAPVEEEPSTLTPGAVLMKSCRCILCDHEFRAAPDAGGRVKCPNCGGSFDA